MYYLHRHCQINQSDILKCFSLILYIYHHSILSVVIIVIYSGLATLLAVFLTLKFVTAKDSKASEKLIRVWYSVVFLFN